MKNKKAICTLPIIFVLLFAAIPVNANNYTVKEAAQYAKKEILIKEGIEGISYTENPDKVIIYIENNEYEEIVPEKIKGYETEIRVSGKFRLLNLEQETMSLEPLQFLKSRESRWDPLIGGISISRIGKPSGTLGIVFEEGSERYILSCAHVFAGKPPDYVPIGTEIVQPSSEHGGVDVVGHLYKYIDLDTSGFTADAALAKCTVDASINEILDYDDESTYTVDIKKLYFPKVGDQVKKSGYNSGVTEGVVEDTHACIVVDTGGPWGYEIFEDQILVNSDFAIPGDSGSVVTQTTSPYRWAGLVWAGSISHWLAVCKASHIIKELGITAKSKPFDLVYDRFFEKFPNLFDLFKILTIKSK